ncbi:MAG: lysine--tRNA ligase [Desulfovibrionaceae bacterium]
MDSKGTLYFAPFHKMISEKEGMNDIISSRIQKASELYEHGTKLYSNSFKRTHLLLELIDEHSATTKDALKEYESEHYKVCGRIILLRSFGKALFVQLKDGSASFQIYMSEKTLGEDFSRIVNKIEIGDFIGVEGFLFRTKTDELTLHASSVQLLTKALRPLPEKYHGLTNIEQRYRQRYVDLIMNEDSKNVFYKRAEIIKTFRHFMENEGFMEVETPMLHAIAGGAAARPFSTHHNALNMELYLRIAPELYLKRLLVGGFEKVFEINRNFRNEGISTKHNPEFTMCEFYWAYTTFETLMPFTEKLFAHIAQTVCGTMNIIYQGISLNFAPTGWKRITFYDSLREIGGHSDAFLNSTEQLQEYIKKKNVPLPQKITLAKLHECIFDIDVEEKLIQPTFLYAYPTELSPLSRRHDSNPDITDRFELFIAGKEIANAFSELNDPIDQRLRFMDQMKEKDAGNHDAHSMDEDYLRALEYGMPPAAGQGIGIDRLTMLLTNSHSIRDVILFPTLKNEGSL